MQFQFFLYHIHTFSSPLIRFSLPPFSIHFSFPFSFIFSTPLFLLSSYSFLFHSPVSPHFPHSLPLSFIFLCIPPSSLSFLIPLPLPSSHSSLSRACIFPIIYSILFPFDFLSFLTSFPSLSCCLSLPSSIIPPFAFPSLLTSPSYQQWPFKESTPT